MLKFIAALLFANVSLAAPVIANDDYWHLPHPPGDPEPHWRSDDGVFKLEHNAWEHRNNPEVIAADQHANQVANANSIECQTEDIAFEYRCPGKN